MVLPRRRKISTRNQRKIVKNKHSSKKISFFFFSFFSRSRSQYPDNLKENIIKERNKFLRTVTMLLNIYRINHLKRLYIKREIDVIYCYMHMKHNKLLSTIKCIYAGINDIYFSFFLVLLNFISVVLNQRKGELRVGCNWMIR